MKLLDQGDEKVQKICDALRRETLEPAQKEAERIIDQANQERTRIVQDAELEAKQIIAKGRSQVEQQQGLFQSSLTQAAKQGVELLKQQIEQALFNPALTKMVEESTSKPEVIAQLVNSIVKAIDRDGLKTDVTAVVSKSVSPDEINTLLLKEVLNRLKGSTVRIGTFTGGAQVKLENKKMTLDISEEALKELLAAFLRENFRSYLFTG